MLVSYSNDGGQGWIWTELRSYYPSEYHPLPASDLRSVFRPRTKQWTHSIRDGVLAHLTLASKRASTKQ